MTEREQLEQAITALEAQRTLLGDQVVETALTPLREKLAALAEQTRKQVTVLFADLSGFTSMTEKLDPEIVGDVMNALWEHIDRIVISYSGLIDKHIGDALMALWGADGAHEDDPERAILAALDMQKAINDFCKKELPQKLGKFSVPYKGKTTPYLQLRVGINTGPVLLGSIGSRSEFSALGDTVNLAKRIEQVAPIGSVLISHATYKQVRGIFDVSLRNPVKLKGKSDTVQTYVVLQPKPRAFRVRTRGIEGIETEMVGRDSELKVLQDTMLATIGKSKPHFVTIIGEAGVGKSRLLYEFDNWIELLPMQIYYFKARALPVTQHISYNLIRDMFATRFNILESDNATTALKKFRAGMAGILESDQADLVGQMVGFDFRKAGSRAVQGLLGNAAFNRLATAYVSRYIQALTQNPTVIFLEDIHWADDSSLELIKHLIAQTNNTRLLIVNLTRPELLERRPTWGTPEFLNDLTVEQSVHKDTYLRIYLSPLTEIHSRNLIGQILQKVDTVPEVLSDLVVKISEGNPYYVEEIIKMLIEDGVIVRGKDKWIVRSENLSTMHIPSTLTGVLQARLDSLPLHEKVILQRAAVIGRMFWDATVEELTVDAQDIIKDVPINTLLDTICNRELIFQCEQSTFENTSEYAFRHAILRDVTYETVLLKLRRVYHAQVAQWLETHAEERLSEYLGLIAKHYELAGDIAKAIDYQQRLAQEALNINAYHDAIMAYEYVIMLSSKYPGNTEKKDHITPLINLGFAYRQIGDYPTAQKYLEQGMALARKYNDRSSIFQALYHMGDVAYRRGEAEKAKQYAQEGLGISQELDDKISIANALKLLGMAAYIEKDYVTAQAYFEESLTRFRTVENLDGQSACLINLGETARRESRYAEAARYYKDSMELNKQVGNRVVIAICLNNLGNVYARMNDINTAWDFLHRAVEEAWNIGTIPILLEAVTGVALVRQMLGEYKMAAKLLGFVREQPTFNAETRGYAQQVIQDLQGKLAAETLEQALESGKYLELKHVVTEILKEPLYTQV